MANNDIQAHSEQYVLMKDLAREIGLNRSTARKYILKSKIPMVRVRIPSAKAQGPSLALTQENADAVRQLRKQQGYGSEPSPIPSAYSQGGYFYIIQLIPELSPGRVKLGFASDVSARLCDHRTAAPTAVLLKSYPCLRTWELPAIASIARVGCVALSNEAYDCDNIEKLQHRADRFFEIMPAR